MAPIDRSPAYSIPKTITDVDGDGAGGEVDEEGDVIGYQIVVSNDGNVDLDGVDQRSAAGRAAEHAQHGRDGRDPGHSQVW